MYEQRLTVRLIDYWNTLRKDEKMPFYGRFNPSTVLDIWPQCMVLKAQNTSTTHYLYTYEHCGTEIAKAVGRNLLGETLTANMKFFPGAKIIRRIDDIAVNKNLDPLYDEGQFVNEHSKVVKYRACLLAFCGTKPDEVSHILVGVSWRAF